jgi:hypothetical protein
MIGDRAAIGVSTLITVAMKAKLGFAPRYPGRAAVAAFSYRV